MRISCDHLGVLFNRLYDRGDTTLTVAHPAAELGELCHITLGSSGDCKIKFVHDRAGYARARSAIERSYPEAVAADLPSPDDYVRAVMASGVIPIENHDEVTQFVDRYGDPDLMAGHPPVVAGFDTNLLPWRIDRILGLRDPDRGVGYVNGFVLATGVRDELDWEYKCHDTDPFVDAFGQPFEEYWNQSLGAARIGRLGLNTYREIRDIQQADEITSEAGDESIIDAYDRYNVDRRTDVLLFSSDRNFVERARAHRLMATAVEVPNDLPRTTSTRWRSIERLVYMLAVVFGVIELPTTTVHGVWRGKDPLDWQHDRLKLDCRSPPVESAIEGDLSIVETYEELRGSL